MNIYANYAIPSLILRATISEEVHMQSLDNCFYIISPRKNIFSKLHQVREEDNEFMS